VSVLEPGACPHEPHVHEEHEVLVVLDGEAVLVVEDGDGFARHAVPAGSFACYPSGFAHTLENASSAPVTYGMVKWTERRPFGAGVVTFEKAPVELQAEAEPGFCVMELFDGIHLTTLSPGAGYEPHADEYDVAFFLLAGEIETLGERAAAPAIAFAPAGADHGMLATGDAAAVYLVFELRR
jgi:uncharacterized cupin superfamily protein